jgi:iron complex transport system substrate-binding protein
MTGLLLCLAGCSPLLRSGSPQNSTPAVSAAAFTDALGLPVAVAAPQRVVAATGSLAHIWLLAGGSLVGVTNDAFDERFVLPPETANIGRLHQIDLETTFALEPDFVILSAELSSQVKLYESFAEAGIDTAYFSVESFADYLAALKNFTDITGRADLYQQNGLDLEAEITGVIEKAKGQPPDKILLLRANSSGINVRNSETMAGIMLRDLGCVNIADSEAALLESLSMEVIIKEDPDFIFAVYQGEDEEKAKQALEEALLSNPAGPELKAVKNGRFIILPKELFHQKPNDRWPEAYQTLYEILYPE